MIGELRGVFMPSASLRKINEEVIYCEDSIVQLDKADVARLAEQAARNRRLRIRICAHRDPGEPLHEMVIVHAKGTYVRPHKHPGKTESFHAVDGRADVVVFDEDGRVVRLIPMGDYFSGLTFFYRMNEPFYHTLVIRTERFVFHEITGGPFRRADTVFAPWSPAEDAPEAEAFLRQISNLMPACEESQMPRDS
jgi:cupin fold WbuC family metalloprotein